MTADFRVSQPEHLEMTLTVTMSMVDWVRLQNQLQSATSPGSFPNWKFRNIISEMVHKANKHFQASATEGEQ